jgi:hypothetical protein
MCTARARELATFVVKKLRALFDDRASELGHADPTLAAHMVHRIVFSLLDQELTFADSSPTGRRLRPRELTTELTRACVAYLGVGTA